MKKIVYIGNNVPASNPTTLLQLSALLTAAGFEVAIYSAKKNKVFRLLTMCFGVIKHRNADYLLIDTYSTINFYYALIVAQLARLFSIPYIPILHGGNLPNRLKQYPWFSALIFKNAYINVAPSNYLLKAFQQKGFKTAFLSNAIAIEKYAYKKRTNLTPSLLWVRAFDKIYNPVMAIKVLYELKKTHSNAVLCMIGPDKDGSLKEVKELAKQYGVLDSVEFTGRLSKEIWIEKSKEFDIFINTTTIDNTPVSVIEAMALGLPVVSTNVGGIPYLIQHGKNGILVENYKVLQMAEAIEELVLDAEKGNEITTNARKMVEEFDTAFVKQQWINLLK